MDTLLPEKDEADTLMRSVYKNVRLDVNLPAKLKIQNHEQASPAKYLALRKGCNRNWGVENTLSPGS